MCPRLNACCMSASSAALRLLRTPPLVMVPFVGRARAPLRKGLSSCESRLAGLVRYPGENRHK